MKYLALVAMLGFCLSGRAQDTIVSRYGSEVICKVEAIVDCNVQYSPLKPKRKQTSSTIPLAYVAMIKYAATGRYLVVYHQPQDPRAARKNCQFSVEKQNPPAHPFNQEQYDEYMQRARAYRIAGITMASLGPATIIAGLGTLASFTGLSNLTTFGTGIGLCVGGLCITVSGIALAIVGANVKQQAFWYRNGLIAISLPQPSYMLPTPQNNFEKGFGMRTGITF